MSTTTAQQANSEFHTHIRIRAMQANDLRAVYKLEKLGQPRPWPAWYFRKQLRNASCWVLEQQGMIIGFGIFSMVKHWAHIMNMGIAPGYRRRGLGRHIMLHILTMARQQHARYSWLEVRATNYPAIHLYRRLGFRKKQVRKNYYALPSGSMDAIVMVRKL